MNTANEQLSEDFGGLLAGKAPKNMGHELGMEASCDFDQLAGWWNKIIVPQRGNTAYDLPEVTFS